MGLVRSAMTLIAFSVAWVATAKALVEWNLERKLELQLEAYDQQQLKEKMKQLREEMGLAATKSPEDERFEQYFPGAPKAKWENWNYGK